jgi:hypothetical protein
MIGLGWRSNQNLRAKRCGGDRTKTCRPSVAEGIEPKSASDRTKICERSNQNLRAIEPKLRAIEPKLRAIEPQTASQALRRGSNPIPPLANPHS